MMTALTMAQQQQTHLKHYLNEISFPLSYQLRQDTTQTSKCVAELILTMIVQ